MEFLGGRENPCSDNIYIFLLIIYLLLLHRLALLADLDRSSVTFNFVRLGLPSLVVRDVVQKVKKNVN